MLTLRDSLVMSNTASADGGGIFNTFSSCGGKCVVAATLTLDASTVSANSAAHNGGGMGTTGAA